MANQKGSSASSASSLRDKLDDDTLDLSLMQLDDVPVTQIAALPKGTTVDLSNNHLVSLPDTFPTLTHLVRLDLSKNRLAELPEYFGQLRSLRHLDLYSNQLQRLPVSFAQLKSLKWLDLKNNPLVPALQQAAGPCITASDCALCAKKVVALLQSMQSQLERERQKLILEEQKVEAARRNAEEQERERIRAEKRAAKERRREEARLKDLEAKRRDAGDGGDGGANDELMREMERPRNGSNGRMGNGVAGGTDGKDGRGGGGWCWSLFMFLLGLAFVGVATGISLLWIYTGGHLDQKSIERALPVIRKDVDATVLTLGKRAETFYDESAKTLGPYAEQARIKAGEAYAELGLRWRAASRWTNQNLGPYCCSAVAAAKRWLAWSQEQVHEGWKWLKPKVWEWWLAARPHFQRLGEVIIEQCRAAYAWAEANLPVYYEWAAEKAAQAYKAASDTVNGMIKA